MTVFPDDIWEYQIKEYLFHRHLWKSNHEKDNMKKVHQQIKNTASNHSPYRVYHNRENLQKTYEILNFENINLIIVTIELKL